MLFVKHWLLDKKIKMKSNHSPLRKEKSSSCFSHHRKAVNYVNHDETQREPHHWNQPTSDMIKLGMKHSKATSETIYIFCKSHLNCASWLYRQLSFPRRIPLFESIFILSLMIACWLVPIWLWSLPSLKHSVHALYAAITNLFLYFVVVYLLVVWSDNYTKRNISDRSCFIASSNAWFHLLWRIVISGCKSVIIFWFPINR